MDRRSMRGRQGIIKTKSSQYQSLKENCDIGTMATSRRTDDLDIKVLQQQKYEAEVKRNQQEEDLRENHPIFDTTFFAVGRESRFGKICCTVVNAQYKYMSRDPVTGKEIKSRYKQLHKLLGLLTCLDWVMIIITTLSCISMMCGADEGGRQQISTDSRVWLCGVYECGDDHEGACIANGFFFTPQALIRDPGSVLDLFIFAQEAEKFQHKEIFKELDQKVIKLDDTVGPHSSGLLMIDSKSSQLSSHGT